MNNKVVAFILIMIFLLYTYSMMNCRTCGGDRVETAHRDERTDEHSESIRTDEKRYSDNIYELEYYSN